ncbi:MAG: ATP-dependent zinc protease [Phycisphaerales bacterium]|nr:ATP-dependent zinc protease [Phycisphaerales bacterium]
MARIIGWHEYVALPEWGIRRLRAKIDTGARTSSIHVASIEPVDDGHLRFEVVTRERPVRRTRWVQAEIVRTAVVKPMPGHKDERPVVRTRMVLAGVELDVEINLVRRTGMTCRMLVGRLALRDHFLVDPSRKHLGDSP